MVDLCLYAHNVLRSLHENTGPMVWDDQLAQGAEQWARKLVNERGLRHSRGNYGENLYAAWGQSASCAKATLSWYVYFHFINIICVWLCVNKKPPPPRTT